MIETAYWMDRISPHITERQNELACLHAEKERLAAKLDGNGRVSYGRAGRFIKRMLLRSKKSTIDLLMTKLELGIMYPMILEHTIRRGDFSSLQNTIEYQLTYMHYARRHRLFRKERKKFRRERRLLLSLKTDIARRSTI